MSGNDAVACGLYEAGCRLVSSYPGTPSTEITESAALYDEIDAEWAPNEDDSVAAVLVKPDGTALTVYRSGFDASGLRKDLAKVTK
jgi:TPP-dependent indolepyruvate ferredoxin oxidoreductase alpha subunit